MGGLKNALVGRSERWVFGEADHISDSPLSSGECYVSAYLDIAYLPFKRRLLRRYFGVVGSTWSLSSLDGGVSTFPSMASPEWLKSIDSTRLDRVVVKNFRMFGPRPYLGGDIVVEIGLFAQIESDSTKPFIKLLTAISNVAGAAFMGPVQLVGPLVEQGMDLLLGDTNASLEVGAVTTIQDPRPSRFVVVGEDSESATPNHFVYKEGVLRWRESGSPVTSPYMVFSLRASDERPDWASVPELRDGWAQCRNAIKAGSHSEVSESLAVFRRACVTSPDLIPNDGKRIAENGARVAKEALQAVQTSGSASRTVPELSDLLNWSP